MPVCERCGKMQPTAEVRLSKKRVDLIFQAQVWVCRDTTACNKRQRERE